MNMPPRVHPTGVAFNGAEDQVKQAMQQEALRQQLRAQQQVPQAQAAAGQMMQQQITASSQPEQTAARLLETYKGGLQAMTLQLDPQSLDGTRAMAALSQRVGSADPTAIAAAIGMG